MMHRHQQFAGLSREAIYQKLLHLAKLAPPFDPLWRTEANRVMGCQSLTYLHVAMHCNATGELSVHLAATSDALISLGLATLLVSVYDGMSPEEVLRHEPTFLRDEGILASLSPTRANGVVHVWLKLKQETAQLYHHHVKCAVEK